MGWGERSNGNKPMAAPQGDAAMIVGQPVSIVEVECVRLGGKLRCNCVPDNDPLTLENGEATCVACGKVFFLLFNPQTMKTELRVQLPKKEPVPA